MVHVGVVVSVALWRMRVGFSFALLAAVLAAVTANSPAAHASPLAGPSRFVALSPQRVIDSRIGLGVPDALPQGGMATVSMGGRGGVPTANVVAVLLNVTMTGTQGPGYVQVFPTGQAEVGASSNLNVEHAGQTIPNLVVAPLGVGGSITIYTQGGGHVVADVFGYFVEAVSARAGRYVSVSPSRLADTRLTSDKLAAAGSLRVAVAGRGSVPASGVSAVVVNLTATEVTADGYLQVLPSSASGFGGYSNLNVTAGQTKANAVVVPVDGDGTITVFAERGAQVVVDVFGYFTDDSAAESADGLFVPLAPTRLLDSRGGVMPRGGSSTVILPGGRAGIPATGVAAVFGNVTATGSTGPGFVQALPGPASSAQFGAWSNLNIARIGETVANAAIANLGTGGSIDVHTSAATHLLFDASGYFTGDRLPSTASGRACVVTLHGKGGGGQQEWTGSDGVRHSFPGGNADGWGGRQWLYFPEPDYEAARSIVAGDIAAGGCQRVIVDGFSNGAAFAAKLYCRNETFGGTVVGYIIDDPVVDHAVEVCAPPAVRVVLYWTGDVAQPDGWPCGDWTCEGDSTIGIDRYEGFLGLRRTPSIWSTHQPYNDPPEVHTWL